MQWLIYCEILNWYNMKEIKSFNMAAIIVGKLVAVHLWFNLDSKQ